MDTITYGIRYYPTGKVALWGTDKVALDKQMERTLQAGYSPEAVALQSVNDGPWVEIDVRRPV